MTFNEDEVHVIGQVLRAAVEGPFFEDWEFHTLFGLTRDEAAAVAAAWPNVDLRDGTVQLAITNSMVNLLGYPHEDDEAWRRYITVPREEVRRILDRQAAALM